MIDKFTYKERDYVEALLNNGFMTKYTYYEMSLLCKYWASMDLPKNEVKQNMVDFCILYNPNFSYALEYKKIKRAVNSAFGKMPNLIQIDSIPIYRHEFKFIEDTELSHNYQRLLFAFLVLKRIHSYIWKINSDEDKFSGFINGDKKQSKLIKEMAHLSGGKKDDLDYMIYDLNDLGYLTRLALGQDYLNFIDVLKEQESEEIIRVSDFEHVWMYFDYLSGYNRAGRVAICRECNKPFHYESKTYPPKYCSECARERQRVRDLEYRRKIRSVENTRDVDKVST